MRLASIAVTILVGCAHPRTTQSTLPAQHAVRHGETIASIAKSYYGEEKQSEGITAILKSNPGMKTPESGPGIQSDPLVLTIPTLEE